MQLIIDGRRFDDPEFHASGGEGEIYTLDNSRVAKVYYEKLRTNDRRLKVLALCDSYANFTTRHANQLIAFPEAPAYEIAVSFDTLVGFAMSRYEFPTISDLGYDISSRTFNEASGARFNDTSALAFVFDIFGVVEQLHQARIVLGDVNPGNIMCETGQERPVFVDIDAAQIGGFPCEATHPNYNDPRLAGQGTGLSGTYTFDFGSDIFALAVVCFEFLVGVRPHYLFVNPPQDDVTNKTRGVSSIRSFETGNHYLASLGLSYFDCKENDAIFRRLNQIKAMNPRLYAFFVDVFVNDHRENILFSLPIDDVRHPGHYFLVESGFKRAIDDEARKRQRIDVTSRQGVTQRAVPDSGFRDVISSLVPKAVIAQSLPPAARKPNPTKRPDPAAFQSFLDQFRLQVR